MTSSSARNQLALLRYGSVLTVATLGALVIGHYALGYEWDVVRTAVFVTLVLVQLAHAFSVRSRLTGRWREGPGRNPLLGYGLLGSLLLQIAVVYTPVGQTLFDTVALPAQVWGIVAGLTLVSFLTVNLSNRITASRRNRPAAG